MRLMNFSLHMIGMSQIRDDLIVRGWFGWCHFKKVIEIDFNKTIFCIFDCLSLLQPHLVAYSDRAKLHQQINWNKFKVTRLINSHHVCSMNQCFLLKAVYQLQLWRS